MLLPFAPFFTLRTTSIARFSNSIYVWELTGGTVVAFMFNHAMLPLIGHLSGNRSKLIIGDLRQGRQVVTWLVIRVQLFLVEAKHKASTLFLDNSSHTCTTVITSVDSLCVYQLNVLLIVYIQNKKMVQRRLRVSRTGPHMAGYDLFPQR